MYCTVSGKFGFSSFYCYRGYRYRGRVTVDGLPCSVPLNDRRSGDGGASGAAIHTTRLHTAEQVVSIQEPLPQKTKKYHIFLVAKLVTTPLI